MGTKVKLTPEIRAEVIEATGLCLNTKCTAHDSVVAGIWEYKNRAKSPGKRCFWCRKAVRWYHLEGNWAKSPTRAALFGLSYTPDPPIHFECETESKKYTHIAERQAERVAG